MRFHSIPRVPYVAGLLWRVKAFLTLLNRRPVRGHEQLLKSGINLRVLRIQLLPSPDTFNFRRNADGRSWSVLCPALWVEVAGIGFRLLFPHQQVVCDLSRLLPPICSIPEPHTPGCEIQTRSTHRPPSARHFHLRPLLPIPYRFSNDFPGSVPFSI